MAQFTLAAALLLLFAAIARGQQDAALMMFPEAEVCDEKAWEKFKAEYKAARNKWESRPRKRYKFTMQRSCYCAPDYVAPLAIKVKRGKASCDDTANANVTICESQAGTLPTMTDIFDDIHKRCVAQCPASCSASYGAVGDIQRFSYDYSAMMVDDEMGLTIRDFELPRRQKGTARRKRLRAREP